MVVSNKRLCIYMLLNIDNIFFSMYPTISSKVYLKYREHSYVRLSPFLYLFFYTLDY
jgi:hypothetical protein